MSAVGAASPYKGLSPFGDSELDALLFFGRERDCEIVVANLIASRLTVLYGPSGVGKSSLLHAGVARALRALPEKPLVVVFSSWGENPAEALAREIASAAKVEGGALAEVAERAQSERDIYVILDQAEEYFTYHGQAEGVFDRAFADVVARPLRVNVLLSLREDAVARLDRFKGRIPGILGNYLRLDRLDRSSARLAIEGPVQRLGELGASRVTIEPQLVEDVLDQVTVGQIASSSVGGVGMSELESRAGIEAPYLQLVMERVWEAERASGSSELRARSLESLGGAQAVVSDHLEMAMDALTPAQRALAARIFAHLVTPSGTKIALATSDLAKVGLVSDAELQPLLDALAERRILRPGDRGRYEIFHDVLAGAVLGWRERYERDRAVAWERVHRRRAVGIAIAALVAVGLMAGVTVFALVQRRDAQEQAAVARARAMDAFATSLLTQDPSLSVALAAEAARLSPTLQAEEVLREALLADRLRAVDTSRGPVRVVGYAPSGNRIVVASDASVARLLDARSHELVAELTHDAAINDAAFSPDGRRALTASRDRTVRIWDAGTGRPVTVLRHAAPVAAASFVRGNRVLTASGHSVTLWPSAGGAAIRRFRQPVPARRAVLSPDGRLVAVLGTDRLIRVFDVESGKLERTLDQRAAPTDAMFRRDGLLAVSDRSGLVRLWKPARGTSSGVLRGHRGGVLDVEWSPDGKRLVTASVDGTARVWDAATGDTLQLLQGGINYVESAAFSRDGRFVVTAGRDGTARTWGVEDAHQYAFLPGSPAPLGGAAYRPDGREVVTAGNDGVARFWDPATEADLLRVSGQGPSRPALSARSPDGRTTATAAGDDVELVGPDGRRRLVGHSDVVNSVAFSPDGSMLVTASRDHDARLWDVRSGRLVHVLDGHFGSVADARFSPDGRWVATAGPFTAGLWRVADGKHFQYLRGPEAITTLTAVEFGPTGIVTRERNGTIRRAECGLCGRTPELLAIADARARATGRVLTADEIRRYG